MVIVRINGAMGEKKKTKRETKVGRLTVAFVLGAVVGINSEMTIRRVP